MSLDRFCERVGLADAGLQARHKEMCDEAVRLSEAIECVRGDVELLRLQMRAVGIAHDSRFLVPEAEHFRAGETPGKTIKELKACLLELVTWLSQRVDISSATVFNVPGEINVKNHCLQMGRMVGWPLTACGGQRLSVPIDLREAVVQILASAKGRDRHSGASEALAEQLAERFEMVRADLRTGESSWASAILLIDTDMKRPIVIACWPPRLALGSDESKSGDNANKAIGFDPKSHFSRPLQRFVFESGKSTEAAPDGTPNVRRRVEVGNRVEAFYSGQWHTGELKSVNGAMASVQCDVDDEGVLTVVPVFRVRLIQLKATPMGKPQSGPLAESI